MATKCIKIECDLGTTFTIPSNNIACLEFHGFPTPQLNIYLKSGGKINLSLLAHDAIKSTNDNQAKRKDYLLKIFRGIEQAISVGNSYFSPDDFLLIKGVFIQENKLE